MKKYSRGFTLFEILIVVVIIGLLAVGLIAAIDPIESIRKSSDATAQVNAQNLQNAFGLYFAREGVMPWGTSPCPATAPAGAPVVNADGTTNPCITLLISSGDLKKSYISSIGTIGKRLFFTGSTAATYETRLSVCFSPQSRDFRTKQTNSGTKSPADDYTALPPVQTYWCTF